MGPTGDSGRLPLNLQAIVVFYVRAYLLRSAHRGFGCEPNFERNSSKAALNASGCWTIARWRAPGMTTSLAPGIREAAPSDAIRNIVRVASPRVIIVGILIWRS